MKTQVCIIGGGPSGLLPSHLLYRTGMGTVRLERRTREYVLGRARAGVLEWRSVELLREAGVGDRMDAEGHSHMGTCLSAQNRGFLIAFECLTGKHVIVCGQTSLTQDLDRPRDAANGTVVHDAEDVELHVADRRVTYRKHAREHDIGCDWIIGCDGFHGVSRRTVPRLPPNFIGNTGIYPQDLGMRPFPDATDRITSVA